MKREARTIIAEYRRDLRFRARVMLHVNLAFNCVFALFDAFFACLHRSQWLGTLAFYYIVLSLMRFFMLRGYRHGNRTKQWKIYRSCGIVILVSTISLAGMYGLIASGEHRIIYPWYFCYAVAAYTFYAVICAIRNVVIYHRINHPIFSASKAVNLVSAAISLFSLQSALLTAFNNDEAFHIAMNTYLGTGVFFVIVMVSVVMVYRARQALLKSGACRRNQKSV